MSSVKYVYDLADMMGLRLEKTSDGAHTVRGHLKWATPWGETIDLVQSARWRLVEDKGHLWIMLPGDVRLYASAGKDLHLALFNAMLIGDNNPFPDKIETPAAVVQRLKHAVVGYWVRENREGAKWETMYPSNP